MLEGNTRYRFLITARKTASRCMQNFLKRPISVIVRDYDSAESVDDESSNLVAEAAKVGRQLFETVGQSEQNTEFVTVREQRAESQSYTKIH